MESEQLIPQLEAFSNQLGFVLSRTDR